MKQKEKTYKDEIKESLQKLIVNVTNWFRYKKGDSIWLFLIHLLWKIPALIIMLCMSPVLLVLLIFTFVVVA